MVVCKIFFTFVLDFEVNYSESTILINSKTMKKFLTRAALCMTPWVLGACEKELVSEDMVASMNKDAIVLAMSNPTPEIMPDLAKKAGARIIGTGRSDFPNQINNVLCFPGIFRGALDCRAKEINEEMKIAASKAIASLVDDSELNEEYILPFAFDKRIGQTVAQAVMDAARRSGSARIM